MKKNLLKLQAEKLLKAKLIDLKGGKGTAPDRCVQCNKSCVQGT